MADRRVWPCKGKEVIGVGVRVWLQKTKVDNEMEIYLIGDVNGGKEREALNREYCFTKVT